MNPTFLLGEVAEEFLQLSSLGDHVLLDVHLLLLPVQQVLREQLVGGTAISLLGIGHILLLDGLFISPIREKTLKLCEKHL